PSRLHHRICLRFHLGVLSYSGWRAGDGRGPASVGRRRLIGSPLAVQVIDAVPNVITKAIPGQGDCPMQRQDQPGVEADMDPPPEYIKPEYKGSGKLSGKVALITGGDSGIGRAVAVHFAREGAKGLVIMYKGGPEDKDASATVKLVEAEGSQCLALVGDVGDPESCQRVVDTCLKMYGQLDVLINNAAEQHYRHSIADITDEQLERTFATNIFGMFYMTKAALPHLKPGSSIVNTTSVTSYQGQPELLDYSSTKGCITAFTRSLSQQLADKGKHPTACRRPAPSATWPAV
ncbi:hypothetical protein QJQ45_017317, partial [Haematococcus lacustris]